MLYLKRIISLIIMLAFAWINNILIKQVGSEFSVQVFGFCTINILLVLLIIYGYHISKAISKNFFVMTSEYLIMAFLVIVAFLPQIDTLFGRVILDVLNLSTDDFALNHIVQFILGYWIISFVNIFKSVHIRRGNVINSIRYMG